jgi:hypothetical protein
VARRNGVADRFCQADHSGFVSAFQGRKLLAGTVRVKNLFKVYLKDW